MAESELMPMMVHIGVLLVAWWYWYKPAVLVRRMGRPVPGLKLALLMPLGCLALTIVGLERYAASDVRGTFYVAWYMFMAAAWVGVGSVWLLAFVGLRHRDDAIERRNPAAMAAVLGGMVGLTLAFLGGNFGDGPSWWVVQFCTLLSYGGFFVAWLLLTLVSPAVQRITVERDVGAGLRVGGLFIGCEAVLGRAVAGDWVSVAGTWHDYFSIAWMVIALVGIESILMGLLPIARRFDFDGLLYGCFPGSAYLALAGLYVAEVGWW